MTLFTAARALEEYWFECKQKMKVWHLNVVRQ